MMMTGHVCRMRRAAGAAVAAAAGLAVSVPALAAALPQTVLPTSEAASVIAETAPNASPALSLMAAWDQAQRHDATFQRALAERDADAEDAIIGRAQLLPQVSVSGSLGKANTISTRQGLLGPVSTEEKYDTESWALQIRQALFRPRALIAYVQGKVVASQAEFRLEAARQNLSLRLIEASALIARSESSLRAAELQRATQGQLVVLVERQQKAGETTRSDVARARADYLAAVREVARQRSELARARETWQQIVGSVPVPMRLDARLVDRLALPLDGQLDTLMQRAEQRNPAFTAARKEIEAARLDVRRAQGDRLPAVDLVASRSFNDSESDNIIGSAFDTSRVAVQASMPLFTGGSLSAGVRQAMARQRVAEAQLRELQARARVMLSADVLVYEETRTAWVAAEASEVSARAALRQAELGRLAGTATLAEFVRAEVALIEARRDKTIALSNLVSAWARVSEVLGDLGLDSLQRLDSAMTLENVGA